MSRSAPSLHLASLTFGVASLFACAAASTAPKSTSEPVVSAPDAPAAEDTAPAKDAAPEPLVLARALHPAPMTEVSLDPRGIAAITLDTRGGARLWPDVHAATIDLPLVLPLTEPSWVTLARAGDDRLVIAALDTAGATQVGEVEFADGAARWRSLFTIPAGEPQLEIHVLDGGERILALSLDHRLRLLDRAGEVVAEIDEPGFVPWQLRIAHQEQGPPKLVAVLAGPVRVQPITIDGDSLQITGEARRVALDRGPNRNDMILSPDGTFVTSLRRIRAKGRGWTMELIDLATDERRWIAGATDGTVRPRLHLLDSKRALLEVGTGRGHLVDLTATKLVPEPVNRRKLPRSRAEVIDVAGSTEESRMLGDLARGVRVFASGAALFVDPVDSGERRTISAPAFAPRHVAFDPTGERVAWLTADELRGELLSGDAPPRVLATIHDPIEVGFVDRDHLIVADTKGKLQLLRWSDGGEVATVSAKGSWGFESARFQRSEDGLGAIVLTPTRGRDTSMIVEVKATSLAPPRELSLEERPSWLAVRDASSERAALATQIRERADLPRVDAVSVSDERIYGLASSSQVVELSADELAAFSLDYDFLGRLDPAPGHRRVALQTRPSASPSAVTVVVVDFDGDSPGRRWSRTFPGSRVDLAWSDDGERLALATAAGGYVVDSATGETLLERSHAGLSVERLPPRGAPVPSP